jgi:hypothetical protein
MVTHKTSGNQFWLALKEFVSSGGHIDLLALLVYFVLCLVKLGLWMNVHVLKGLQPGQWWYYRLRCFQLREIKIVVLGRSLHGVESCDH